MPDILLYGQSQAVVAWDPTYREIHISGVTPEFYDNLPVPEGKDRDGWPTKFIGHGTDAIWEVMVHKPDDPPATVDKPEAS